MPLTQICEVSYMKRCALTTASFCFFFGWARFMSTGYFVLGKYREMEWMCRSQSGTAALSV